MRRFKATRSSERPPRHALNSTRLQAPIRIIIRIVVAWRPVGIVSLSQVWYAPHPLRMPLGLRFAGIVPRRDGLFAIVGQDGRGATDIKVSAPSSLGSPTAAGTVVGRSRCFSGKDPVPADGSIRQSRRGLLLFEMYSFRLGMRITSFPSWYGSTLAAKLAPQRTTGTQHHFPINGVGDSAAGNLSKHTRYLACRERQTDALLGPSQACQIKSDKSAQPGLHAAY